jgi:ATP-binding cassette subfamily B protein
LDTLIAGKSATVILVAHRLSTVRNADAIAVVGDGRVLELGDHDALVARKGIYATLVSRQLQVSANTIDETKVDAAAAAHALDIDELIRQAQEAQDALVAAPGRS